MSAEQKKYEDLGLLYRVVVTAYEERSVDGVPLSILAAIPVGLAASYGIFEAEQHNGLGSSSTVTQVEQPGVTNISGIELGSTVGVFAFTVAAIHYGVRRRYKKIIKNLSAE